MIPLLAQTSPLWFAFFFAAVSGCGAFIFGMLRHQSGRPSQARADGMYYAVYAVAPGLFCFLIYALIGEAVVSIMLQSELPSGFAEMSPLERGRYLDRVSDVARSERYFPAETVFGAIVARMRELRGASLALLLGFASLASIGGILYARRRKSRKNVSGEVDAALESALFLAAAAGVAITAAIFTTLVIEAARFFQIADLSEFLLSGGEGPQSSGGFGAASLFYGTFFIALIAIAVAAPIGGLAAVYLSEYAAPRSRAFLQSVLEILAGVPTVVYGFFALFAVAPIVRAGALQINAGLEALGAPESLFLSAQPTNALAAGIVMGVMIIPYVSSLTADIMSSTPREYREAALALGATNYETVRQVILPAAFPGLLAALFLALSRAIGETMIVLMAAGQRPHISLDPTADMTTVTAQIISRLAGDPSYSGDRALSASALGLCLFIVTAAFNIAALRVISRFRRRFA